MVKYFFALFCFVLIPVPLFSQVFPHEGSSLNYRLIGFSFPDMQKTGSYKLEIAEGTYSAEDSFKKNIVKTVYCKTNKVIAEVPSFGKQYTWQVISDHGTGAGRARLYHFSTSVVPAVDTHVTRLRILKNAGKYKDACVFLDGSGVLYDMNGNAIWYLPDVAGYNTQNSNLRDLKLSARGTITFIYEQYGAYEVDYNGTILWKAPDNGRVSGDNTEYYHHELTRLANGHYMILGCEYESWNRELPSPVDTEYRIFHAYKMRRDSVKKRYISLPFGTIIEYDEKGNVVWSWKSSEYFRNSDIYYHKMNEGGIAAHENSFYFDEEKNVIYIGFRNISRILKIKYPEGVVLNAYGEIYKAGVPEAGNGQFCSQHSVRRSAKGYMYLYNNNSCINTSEQSLPEILKFEEPAGKNEKLKKIWEYKCSIDGVNADHPPYQFPAGGNVAELQDGALFANMSTVYSKVFILSPDKKIIWSAIPEKRDTATNKWTMIYNYRASIIVSKKDLETLIWNSEK